MRLCKPQLVATASREAKEVGRDVRSRTRKTARQGTRPYLPNAEATEVGQTRKLLSVLEIPGGGAVRYRISIFMWFQLLPLPSIYAPIRPHLLALTLSPGFAPFPPGVCGVLFGKASSPFAFPTRLLVRVSHHLFPALEVNYLPTLKLLSLAEEATQ